VFLAEMAAVVPWAELEAVIAPHYPKIGLKGGRRPFAAATMLRIYSRLVRLAAGQGRHDVFGGA
jgi:hypothetical protein